MRLLNRSFLRALSPVAAILWMACTLESTPKENCNTTSDCNTGRQCHGGTCMALESCATTFPPLSCMNPEGPIHPTSVSELTLLLPGQWLYCTGDMSAGAPLKIGPQDNVGFEFNRDGTWYFLVNNGAGRTVHRSGFSSGGTYAIGDNGAGDPQLNLSDSGGGWFALLPAVTDGPPKRLRLISHGPAAYYVASSVPAGCDSVDASIDRKKRDAGVDMRVDAGVDMKGDAGVDMKAQCLVDLSAGAPSCGPDLGFSTERCACIAPY